MCKNKTEQKILPSLPPLRSQTQTPNNVVNKLSSAGMYESRLLICAKALAINYFCIPGLARALVRSVVQATPIVGRRGRRCVRRDRAGAWERGRVREGERVKE